AQSVGAIGPRINAARKEMPLAAIASSQGDLSAGGTARGYRVGFCSLLCYSSRMRGTHAGGGVGVVATLGAVGLVCALPACTKDDPPPAPTPVAAPVPTGPCAGGKSDDPPAGVFKPAQNAFNSKSYSTAKSLLADIADKYPNSSSVRVWQGDAAMFDTKTSLTKGADEGIEFYGKALALHDKGCGLPIYERYYMRMGFGYAYLRKKDGKNALIHLKAAEEEIKDSSGLYYNMARAYCRADDVDQCAAYIRNALANVKALNAPPLLLSHYSF